MQPVAIALEDNDLASAIDFGKLVRTGIGRQINGRNPYGRAPDRFRPSRDAEQGSANNQYDSGLHSFQLSSEET
jgi:hypothetical protein